MTAYSTSPLELNNTKEYCVPDQGASYWTEFLATGEKKKTLYSKYLFSYTFILASKLREHTF